jgi:hypothetical protein
MKGLISDGSKLSARLTTQLWENLVRNHTLISIAYFSQSKSGKKVIANKIKSFSKNFARILQTQKFQEILKTLQSGYTTSMFPILCLAKQKRNGEKELRESKTHSYMFLMSLNVKCKLI